MASQRKKPARKAPKKAPVRKQSTALARRPKQELVTSPAFSTELPPVVAAMALSDVPMIAVQHVGVMKLEKSQIEALRRPLAANEIEWKPAKKDGPATIPYVAHTAARDRLDEAFGLGGWGMVPVTQPKEKDGEVLVYYAMVIGGLPRFYAWGQQEIRDNQHMTWGDCLEATKSNAIVRCGKDLGIGRELWNRAGRARLGGKGQSAPIPSAGNAPPRQYAPASSTDTRPISDGQRRRLFVIAKHAGRNEADIKAWLAVAYNIDSSKKIQRKDYDAICSAIEAPGPLGKPTDGELVYDREPGEEG